MCAPQASRRSLIAPGIIGSTVVWYNDLEDGFNRSRYTRFGTIDDWCNQDELEQTLGYLMIALRRGHDMIRIVRKR